LSLAELDGEQLSLPIEVLQAQADNLPRAEAVDS